MLLGLCMCLSLTSLVVFATGDTQNYIAEDKEMRLFYDEPAEMTPTNGRYTELWDGWHSSIPLGNGYVGATVFGGVEREHIQITEKSFFASSTDYIDNCFKGGLESFAETYLEFSHTFANVTDYARVLTLSDGIAKISYTYGGVNYTREVFTSYPDRVIAIHLTASEEGALDFALAPEIPYLRDEADLAASEYYYSGMTKTGTVVADATNATVTLSGTAEYYNLNYEALYRVESNGTYSADNSGEFGKLVISDATEATVYIALGTNYKLTSETFTNSRLEKLDPTEFPHDSLLATLDAIDGLTYQEVRARHIADHGGLYNRVKVDLGGTMPSITTDEMLYQYKLGNFKNNYIYELYYQIGRYIEIASSRDGTLPSNLMGAWCIYQFAPWTAGNWYNINQQMNYWGVFAANLTETFASYLQFNEARMEQAKKNADAYVLACNPSNYTEPGTNGWLVGTGNSPYTVGTASPGGHSGVGTVGMTTIDYWNYYLFTLDEKVLYETIFTVLQESARFYTKFAVLDENGLYLCTPSASPEQNVNGKPYITVGCAFDQQMMYENNFNYLSAVEVVRAYEQKNNIESSIIDEALLTTVNEQIEHYDPVIVGLSGQIKEYREEGLYGEYGEIAHRHISQLMGIANGMQINSNTPHWLDAARTTLILRKSLTNGGTGWGDAQRMFAFARCGDGESAMVVLKRLTSNNLYNNMWNNHARCFQVDGNLGVMAAISEMLVQSHEGYINLLPAISDDIQSGSVSGILARGNFTVDFAWENGAPTTMTVTSGSGSDLGVYYPAYSDIVITNRAGETVDYTIVDGVIRLSTTAGETYTITGFTPKAKAKMPQNLTATNRNGIVTLNWEASPSAGATYNVYRAFDSEKGYTFLGSTSALTFVDTEKGDRQATYAVRAINADTIESLGAVKTVIGTPPSPENTSAYALGDGRLQLVWDTVDGCEAYRIYKNGELVCESAIPLAVVDGSGAYTVTALYYGSESRPAAVVASNDAFVDKTELYDGYLFVVGVLGNSTFYDKTLTVDKQLGEVLAVLSDRGATEDEVAKALETLQRARDTVLFSKRNLAPTVKSYTVSPAPYSDVYLEEYMIDGNPDSRYAAIRTGTGSVILAEFDLGGVYSISSIDFIEFADKGVPRSELLKVEFLVNGKWEVAFRTDNTATLGTGSSNKFNAHLDTDPTLQASKVRFRLEQTTKGQSMNLSIWELQIWGNNFNINGNIQDPVFNPEKPTDTNYAVSEFFDTDCAVYTDRTADNNFMSAIHVGSALKGLKQIRLPIMESSRTSNDALKAFLSGNNTYFTFRAECDGTVYVVFPQALVNFTEAKGWRLLASGQILPLPSGETLTSLDKNYSDENYPYYFTRLQANRTAGTVTGTVAFTWCYALDFKAGDIVEIPTPATTGGITNENLTVLVDCKPTSPFISSISAGGEYFTPDEDDTFTVRVPEETKVLTFEALTLAENWKCTFTPSPVIELFSDYTVLSVTVSDGETEKEYRICIIKSQTDLLDGVTGTLGSSHYEGYFANNDIPGNIAKLTDGDEGTFLRVWHSVPKAGALIFSYDLGTYHPVDTFYIHSNASGGISLLGEVKVEGYIDGVWVTIATMNLPTIGVVEGNSVTASVTLDAPVSVSAIRFTTGYNPQILTSDGTSLSGYALQIHEISARCENLKVSAPALASLKVNGKEALLQDGKYYIMVDKTVKELLIEAMAADSTSTITYTPSNKVAFDGRKQTLTVTVTNILGEYKTYTLVVDGIEPTKNVLSGITPSFVISAGLYADYPLAYATDGNFNTRLAVYEKKAIEIEYVLDGIYDITEMRFSAYIHGTNTLTGNVTVRAMIDGKWTDIAICDTASGFELYGGDTGKSYKTFSISAKGVSAIRLYIEQNPTMLDRGISIWEIDIQGTPASATPAENVLTGTTPSFVIEGSLHANYPLSNIVDGSITTRAALQTVKDIEIEFPLDGKYDITSLTLCVWADNQVSRTSVVIVRALIDGEWVDVATDDLSQNPSVINGSTVSKTIFFEAKGVEALRVYFTQNPNGTQKGQSIWEVSAMGSKSVNEEIDVSDFTLFTSVSLHANFDLNVYIPYGFGIANLNFAGTEYDISKLSPVEVDGKLYYKLTLPVDAKDAYKTFPLTVVLTKGEKSATGTFNISLLSYLAKLLVANTDATEKALVLDILAYIRSAISYFYAENTEVIGAVSAINQMLGRYAYAEKMPSSLENPPAPPVAGIGVSRIAFSLDSEVSFALALEEGYSLNDFTFTLGGKRVVAIEKDGIVFITVDACRIKDTLHIEVKDKDDETLIHSADFSLALYYASETVQNTPALVTLVERLAAFSESADAYRVSRVNS